MAVKEILELENNRDSSTLGKIYFYKEGNSPWYRAYELSAYFASFYDNGLDDKKRLHAVKKSNKLSEDGIISVGLQLPSFKKYFPDVNVDDMSGDRFSSSSFPSLFIFILFLFLFELLFVLTLF